MSALSLSDIEDRFMQLAAPVIDEFTNQIDSLLAAKFSEFQSELASRTQGSTSGFVTEKLKALMDKLAERLLTIKDEYIAQLKGKINSAVLEADDGTSLDDNIMSSFINDNASNAINSCLEIFSQESEQVIIEGLEGIGLDDNEGNGSGDSGSGGAQDGDVPPPPPEDDADEIENSMSGSVQDSGASETTEGSEVVDDSENSQEVVTMPTDPPKRKGKSKISSMLSRRAKKTASGNFRNVPLS